MEGGLPTGAHSWRRRGEDVTITLTALVTVVEEVVSQESHSTGHSRRNCAPKMALEHSESSCPAHWLPSGMPLHSPVVVVAVVVVTVVLEAVVVDTVVVVVATTLIRVP